MSPPWKRWRDAEEGERRSRARFAQNALKPEEVAPEWKRWRELLGDRDEVRRFTERAMSRRTRRSNPSAPLSRRISRICPAPSQNVSAHVISRGVLHIAFTEPTPARAELITRSHPLPSVLAETLLEGALDSAAHVRVGRTGAWRSASVEVVTFVALLRLRFKLTVHGRREKLLLAEEADALAFGPDMKISASGEAARALLEKAAAGNLADVARDRLLKEAHERVATALETLIADYSRARAEALAYDHARVRATGVSVSRVDVEPVLPADVVGLFALIPAGL